MQYYLKKLLATLEHVDLDVMLVRLEGSDV